MSDTEERPHAPLVCPPGPANDELLTLDASIQQLGSGLSVRRALPKRTLRTIGAWCFLDHFGPHQFSTPREAMYVGAHPHIGLQTVTWLTEGEVLHRDSLGTVATIEAGGLNVMTSGRGIAHTEETPNDNAGVLHGLQLWLALPERRREMDPAFEHVFELPVWRDGAAEATLFIGDAFGLSAGATIHSPLMGAELRVPAGRTTLPVTPEFEHGLLVMEGSIRVDDRPLEVGQLGYLSRGRRSVCIEAEAPARLGMIGGEPYTDPLLMWWNFVGGSYDEIHEARRAWLAGERFGAVHGFDGPALGVPDLLLSRR